MSMATTTILTFDDYLQQQQQIQQPRKSIRAVEPEQKWHYNVENDGWGSQSLGEDRFFSDPFVAEMKLTECYRVTTVGPLPPSSSDLSDTDDDLANKLIDAIIFHSNAEAKSCYHWTGRYLYIWHLCLCVTHDIYTQNSGPPRGMRLL